MKISARNVYPGTITAIKQGPVNAEVELRLDTGETIVAGITEASVQSLGMAAGRPATAIIKAPLVMLATDTDGWRFTARNQLQGTVIAVEAGAVNASVSLKLAGGAVLSSVVTLGTVADLGLQPGVSATALFKAGAVVLGLAD